jgi:hypothetical protein
MLGSAFAGEYYFLDTYYPGGVYGAVSDYPKIVKEQQEITPGFGIFPP